MASTAPPPSAPGWLARWSPAAALRRRFRAWWQGRLKRTDTLELTQRNVYILPTGPGWMLAVTLVVLLIASINFQLNLGYLSTIKYNCDVIMGATFKVEDNEKTGGYTVTVVGYPGIFVNWHPATQDDYEWKLMDPTFASSGKQSREIMQYIGNGSNYKAKYSY
jgi:hypothetical protein